MYSNAKSPMVGPVPTFTSSFAGLTLTSLGKGAPLLCRQVPLFYTLSLIRCLGASPPLIIFPMCPTLPLLNPNPNPNPNPPLIIFPMCPTLPLLRSECQGDPLASNPPDAQARGRGLYPFHVGACTFAVWPAPLPCRGLHLCRVACTLAMSGPAPLPCGLHPCRVACTLTMSRPAPLPCGLHPCHVTCTLAMCPLLVTCAQPQHFGYVILFLSRILMLRLWL